MTDLTNYLMPPQEPNMLAYDDTQGMRSRPADPLRWLADYVGQNKDLPAPQFFMDPRALSARNMLHSALNTSANWLDGTRDPSAVKVGPDTIAPLGLAGFGTGMANAMTRGSRAMTDAQIADQLGRLYPEAIAGGDMLRAQHRGKDYISVAHDGKMTPVVSGHIEPAKRGGGVVDSKPDPRIWTSGGADNINVPDGVSVLPAPLSYGAPRDVSIGTMHHGYMAGRDRIWVSGPDGMTTTHAFSPGRPGEAGGIGTFRPDSKTLGGPAANYNGPYAVMADNARSSAPGTVVNSIAEGASRGRTVADELLGIGMDANRFRSTFEALKADKTLSKADWDDLANHFQNAPTGSTFRHKFKNIDEAKNFVWKQYVARHSSDTRQQRVQELTKFPGDAQSSPYASAPGLAANSTQQDDQGVMSILKKYGLFDQ